MKENRNGLVNYAMSSGLILGVFWMLKYFVAVAAHQISMLTLFTSVLMFGTPLILLYFLVQYRLQITGGTLRFGHGVQFTIMLFFFASILESVIVYIHITWIDPTFVGNMYTEMVDALRELNIAANMAEALEREPVPGGLNYIINHVLFANIFIGMVLSIFLIPLSKRLNFKGLNIKKPE